MILRTSFLIQLFIMVSGEKRKNLFEETVEKKAYIDKSLFIKDFVERGNFLYVRTPRSFGKTTNLDMMHQFLGIQVNKNGEVQDRKSTKAYEIFKKQKIHENEIFFYKHFQKYPVLYLNFQELRPVSTYPEFRHKLTRMLSPIFSSHSYLKNSTKAKKEHKETFQYLTDTLLKSKNFLIPLRSGRFLTQYLATHYDSKCVVLIDEYDSVLESILEKKKVCDDEMQQITKEFEEFVSLLLENNRFIGSCLITSSFHLAKESYIPKNTFYSAFPDDEQIAKYYGFTEEEVLILAILLKPDYDIIRMKEWYGGFTVKGVNLEIYNPNSIIKHFNTSLFANFREEPTSLSTLSLSFNDLTVKAKIQLATINGTTIIDPGDPLSLYDLLKLKRTLRRKSPELTSKQVNLFFQYLVETGYFLVVSQSDHGVTIKPANTETKYALVKFTNMTLEWPTIEV